MLAATLQEQTGVLYAEPQLRQLRQKKFIPNDSWFPSQWHLRNVEQSGGISGVDINAVSVWEAWRGNGVAVEVVDDGVQSAHPDLLPNLDAGLSVNFNASTFDPVWDAHGTPVAGIIGARGNNGIGVAGVSFADQEQSAALGGHALNFAAQWFAAPASAASWLLFGRGHAHGGRGMGVASDLTVQHIHNSLYIS